MDNYTIIHLTTKGPKGLKGFKEAYQFNEYRFTEYYVFSLMSKLAQIVIIKPFQCR